MPPQGPPPVVATLKSRKESKKEKKRKPEYSSGEESDESSAPVRPKKRRNEPAEESPRRVKRERDLLMRRVRRASRHAAGGGGGGEGGTLPHCQSDLSIVAKVALAQPAAGRRLHHAKTVARMTRKSSFGRLTTKATATADYAAQSDREVSMKEGEEVTVIRTHHSEGPVRFLFADRTIFLHNECAALGSHCLRALLFDV